MAETEGSPKTFRERLLDFIPALLIVAGLAGLSIAFIIGGGDGDGEQLDPAIEELIPASGAEVLKQSQVGIDLESGFTAVLILNDVRIPEDQVNRLRDPDDPDSSAAEAGDFANTLNRFVYQPLPERIIEELRPDENCMRVEFWPLADPSDIRDVEWCFTAA